MRSSDPYWSQKILRVRANNSWKTRKLCCCKSSCIKQYLGKLIQQLNCYKVKKEKKGMGSARTARLCLPTDIRALRRFFCPSSEITRNSITSSTRNYLVDTCFLARKNFFWNSILFCPISKITESVKMFLTPLVISQFCGKLTYLHAFSW